MSEIRSDAPSKTNPTGPAQPLTVETAAIRIGEAVFTLPRPNRHHNILWWLHVMGIGTALTHDTGFVLSDGRYVGRQEGAEVAIASGQVSELISPPRLYSEDLWDGGAHMPKPAEIAALAAGQDLDGQSQGRLVNYDLPPSEPDQGEVERLRQALSEAVEEILSLAHARWSEVEATDEQLVGRYRDILSRPTTLGGAQP